MRPPLSPLCRLSFSLGPYLRKWRITSPLCKYPGLIFSHLVLSNVCKFPSPYPASPMTWSQGPLRVSPGSTGEALEHLWGDSNGPRKGRPRVAPHPQVLCGLISPVERESPGKVSWAQLEDRNQSTVNSYLPWIKDKKITTIMKEV